MESLEHEILNTERIDDHPTRTPKPSGSGNSSGSLCSAISANANFSAP